MIKFELLDGTYKNVAPEHLEIFKERYPNAVRVDSLQPLDSLRPLDSPTVEPPKSTKASALEGVWGADMKLTHKLAISAAALYEGLKDPVERVEIIQHAINIKNDLPLHLMNAVQSAEAATIDFLSKAAGNQQSDFFIELLRGKDVTDKGVITFIDPDTQNEVTFESDEMKWMELNKRHRKGEEIQSFYSGSNEELGQITDEYLVNKLKQVEATKLLYQYDGKGMVKGVKTGDVSDVVGGVMNSISSMLETMGPALATKGLSLFPQIAAPMYVEYNTAKATQLYGDDPDAIEKLVLNNNHEVAIPLALGVLATGLEYVGFKNVTRAIMNQPGKGKMVGKLLWVGNAEGATEWGQHGVETMNASLGSGKNVLEASNDGIKSMFSEEGLEMYLSGFIGATAISSTGNALNRALRSDNASIKEINNKLDNIARLNYTKYNTTNKDVKDAIDLEVKTAEQELRDYINEKRKLSKVLTKDEKTSLINTLNEKDGIRSKAQSLRAQLESGEINNKEFGYAIRSLNNQDKKLSEQLSEIQSTAIARAAEKITAAVRKQVGKIAEQKGVEGVVTEATSQEIADVQGETLAKLTAERDSNQEILDDPNQTAENKKVAEENVKDLNEQIEDIENADLSYGYIDEKVDDEGNLTGDFEIIINKDKPMLGTAAHEFMHKVLFKTLKGNKTLQDNIGNALIDFINDVKGGASEAFINRMGAYIRPVKDKDGNVQYEKVSEFGEETVTVLSESLFDGTQEYDEGLMTRLRDIIRQTFQRYGIIDIELNEGKDVYNFIKDYNRSIEKGYTSKAITKMAVEGAKGKLVEGKKKAKPKAKRKMSKDASDNVQRIYEEQGEGGAMDIIEQFKPITSRIAERRREAPNYDKELLMSEIEIGERGILDLIREYKPESGVPLAAYINKYLPARAIEASKRVLGEEFTEDISERVDIAAEEVTAEVKTKPKKKKIVLADRLGVTDKVAKAIKKIVPDLDIDKLTFKNLKNKIPNITGGLFGISPKKLISGANITKKELQSAQMFINKNADLLITMLPEGATASGTATGIPKTLLKAFYTKTDRAKMAKTGTRAGLAIQEKNEINKKDFLEVFGIIDGKPVRTDRNTSARVLALANTLGKMITNQAVRQEIGEGTVKVKEAVSRVKDGKSTVMFSKPVEALANPLDNFKATYEHKIGILSESLGIKLTTKKTFYRTNSKGKRVPYRSRNLDAKFNDKETYKDAGVRVVNTFLESHPQFRDLIKITTTGGLEGGFFQTVGVFNSLINKTDVKQAYIARTKYSGEGAVYSETHYNNLKEGKLDEANNSRLPLLLDFFKAVEAHLQNFPDDIWMFEEIILDTGKQQNVFTRILAPFAFYPSVNGKPIFTQKIKEEHTDPQNLIGKAMLSSAFFGKVDEVWKVIGKSYMQGALLDSGKNPHDKMIEDAGYSGSMPDVYYEKIVPRLKSGELKLPNGYASVVRLAAAGIDLNMYVFAKEGVTIAEFFKVDGIKNPDGSNNVEKQNEIIIKQLAGEVAPKYGENIAKVKVVKNVEGNQRFSKAMSVARTTKYSKESKGITVLDFDDTLATTKSLVRFTAPDGTKGALNAEQYASQYQDLLAQGYEFDFTEFDKVVKAKLAPLFQKALKLQKKFGPENMFILTARPSAAQKAIYDFLKANGLNIPLKNITGLGNSTAEAKALWIADKVADGYNDFYFADDALQNVQAVQNMLGQFDVKSKVQQAKIKFSKDMNENFNDILENVTGIQSQKRFSAAKARKRGEGKGRFRFFIPPSHEDFVGLLYNFIGKGEKGNQHRNFFEQALVKPLNRAFTELNAAKQSISNDYKNLIKQFPDVRKKLTKKTPDGDFTYGDAVRVYLWQKAGFKVPGLSETDLQELSDLVKADPKLQAFADTLGLISKQKEGYVKPTEEWEVGDVRTDLADATMGIGRKQFFGEFIENADVIFSIENLNKIEAAYGKNFREALEDMLYRIKTGRNRPTGSNRLVNRFTDWINGAVGSTMFLNARSGILQQLSIVNFINYGDNNIFKAAAAFANQLQYWKDYAKIFNSDFLKQRRRGIGFDVNGAELAQAVSRSKEPARAAIRYLLQKGFILTQLGDSNAIAMGGATFYRNRVNTYLKQGLSQKEAEAKAWIDFVEIAETTQQSARPDMISQQQSSPLGKFILAFQNTPSQYNRFGIKKPALDLINRRKSPPYKTQWQSDMSNISRILYYGTIQNLIFYGLQSAIFALAFSDDDEDEEFFEKKRQRIINGSIDSVLRGMGVGGAIVSTLKNAAMKIAANRGKTWNASTDVLMSELLQLSPPLGIKARKLSSAEKTMKYNKEVIKEMETFDIDNPVWDAVSNVIEGTTNIPVHRLHRKVENLRGAQNAENEWWQRLFLGLGWGKWELGVEDREVETIKKDIKKRNKKKGKRSPLSPKPLDKLKPLK